MKRLRQLWCFCSDWSFICSSREARESIRIIEASERTDEKKLIASFMRTIRDSRFNSITGECGRRCRIRFVIKISASPGSCYAFFSSVFYQFEALKKGNPRHVLCPKRSICTSSSLCNIVGVRCAEVCWLTVCAFDLFPCVCVYSTSCAVSCCRGTVAHFMVPFHHRKTKSLQAIRPSITVISPWWSDSNLYGSICFVDLIVDIGISGRFSGTIDNLDPRAWPLYLLPIGYY